MEQQAPGSPAGGTAAGPGAAEGQGSQDASQALPGAEGIEQPPLVQAILAGDNEWLSELLAAASLEQLAEQPVPLLHAAAAANNANAVRMLAAAGMSAAALNAQRDGAVLASLVEDASVQQQLTGWRFTPLAFAAWRCRADTAAALLAAGAALEEPSLDTSTQPARQLTPLSIVADDPLPGSSEAVAGLLLAFGADVAAVGPAELQRCAEICPGLASLLRAVQQAPGGAAGDAEAEEEAGAAESAEGSEAEDSSSWKMNSILKGVTAVLEARKGYFVPPTPPAGAGALQLLPLYHAAVLWGDAYAVRLLASVGLPLELEDACCYGPAMAGQLHIEPDDVRQLFGEFSGTALGLAARLGDVSLVEALLEAGADVNQPSPRVHVPGVLTKPCAILGRLYRPATSLDIVACCAAEFGEQRTVELLQQLLAAGASVTSMDLRALLACSRACSSTTRLLLQHFQRASEEGRLPMSAEEEDPWHPLLWAAAACDSVPALEHFLGRVLQLPVSDRMRNRSIPITLFRAAIQHESLGVLRLAAGQQESGSAAGEGSLVATTLQARFEQWLPRLLEKAASGGHAAALRLILEAGGVPTFRALSEAAWYGHLRCLNQLLSCGVLSLDGLQPLPKPVRQPSCARDFQRLPQYPCALLTLLQTRLAQAVDPLDARLLPLVEALVDAGYRPRTFTDAPVHMEFVDEPVLRRLFDPLHVIEGDPGLQVAGANRWMAMAATRPDWSPVSHSLFMPSFRAAVRTFLLVLHRGGHAAGAGSSGTAAELQPAAEEGSSAGLAASGAARLVSPPPDLLHRIIGQAAYPLSAWAPLDAAAAQAAAQAAEAAAAVEVEEAEGLHDVAGEQKAAAERDADAAEDDGQEGEAAGGAAEAAEAEE